MRIRDVVDALEKFAPLPLQEEYDNSGLQVGLTETEVSGALLCLDVTEAVIQEAVSLGCNLIVSHHPLLFRPLKSITDRTESERCVIEAIRNDIALYAAHTNLDNANGGVNFKIASRLGLTDISWLESKSEDAGCGITGILRRDLREEEFISFVKDTFAVPCLRCNGQLGRPVHKVAVCGGAGAFLIPSAVASGADAFITGEIGYHRFSSLDGTILLMETGHFESEQYTVELLGEILHKEFPHMRVEQTSHNTNPIRYF